MQANWIIIGIVIVAAIVLVTIVTRENHKDQKEYEQYLNNQSKPKNETDVEDGL